MSKRQNSNGLSQRIVDLAMASPLGRRLAVLEELRRTGQWAEAAEKYASIARAMGGGNFVWVHAANCYKEAGLYHQAYDAFQRRLRRHPLDDDCQLQYGHFLKVTGNFLAAEQAYMRSAAGANSRAADELSVDRAAWAPALRFAVTGTPANAVALVAMVKSILYAPIDPDSLRQASVALKSNGEARLARAFGAIAFLMDRAPGSAMRMAAFAGTSQLWAGLEFATPSAGAATGKPAGSLARLREIINLARDECRVQGAVAPVAPDRPVLAAACEPEVIGVEQAETLLDSLCTKIDAMMDAIVREDHDANDIFSAGSQLASAAQRPGRWLALPGSDQDLLLVAARVLHDCVGLWSGAFYSRYLGTYASPQLVTLLLRQGGNPLVDRISEIGVQQAAYELNGMIAGCLSEDEAAQADRVSAAVLALCLPDLKAAQIAGLFGVLHRFAMPLANEVLTGALESTLAGQEVELVEIAMQLKAVGQSGLGLKLLVHALDEQSSNFNSLQNMAILAKIEGDFERAARLFEACYRHEPSEFLRRELLWVLPEVEPASATIKRFADDPAMLHLARERLHLRLALEGRLGAVHDGGGDLRDIPSELTMEGQRPLTADRFTVGIRVLQIGKQQRQRQGEMRSVLGGIAAIRVETAFAIADSCMRVRLDGRSIAYDRGTRRLAGFEGSPFHHRTYNLWVDLSGVEAGSHVLQFYVEHPDGGYDAQEHVVWVDHEIDPGDMAVSPRLIALPENADGTTVEEQVAALPSLVMQADRNPFGGVPSCILVTRVDQLGDTVLSVPAILALRRHFPDARLIGLFSPALRDVIQRLGVFDEILTLNLPYDQSRRRRYAPLSNLVALRRQLLALAPDVAIDLSGSQDTRPLLRLSGARYTVGFHPREFPWLTMGIDLILRDPGNGHAAVSHAHAPLSLVESFAQAALRRATVLDKVPLDDAVRGTLGIPSDRPFVVLHSGARTATRKWPMSNFLDVARRLIRETGVFIVLMLDSPADLPDTPADLSDRDLAVVRQTISFEQFDALLSQAAVVVGNDTGPKHLAALRGTPVVSIHMGAVNWSEWGQDGGGVIVTRRVPCYGCGIELEEECGRGLPCLRDISVDEIFEEVRNRLSDT